MGLGQPESEALVLRQEWLLRSVTLLDSEIMSGMLLDSARISASGIESVSP